MRILVKRRFFGENYTIGSMFLNGEYFCDTIEDKYKDLSLEPKVDGETAIPFGNYNVVLSFSSKFKRALPRLMDVPFFEGILIRSGNSEEKWSGCIIVGDNRVKGAVVYSRIREDELMRRLNLADERGESITIEISH